MINALLTPPPAMPFIEDVDSDDAHIKSEIKAEPTGRESPLFEPQQSTSTKRSMEDEIVVSDVKKLRAFTETGPLAYNGNPVRQWVPESGEKYQYGIHEVVPELEINSKHHRDSTARFIFYMENVAIPSLSINQDEDKTLNDTVEWLKKNAKIPEIKPTRFVMLGSSGCGKTSTLNNILGVSKLAASGSALLSLTQNPHVFIHAPEQLEMYSVKVEFLHGRPIDNLIKNSVTDLVNYFKYLTSEDEEEQDRAHDMAESGRQVLNDLLAHQGGLQTLDDLARFLKPRDLLPQMDRQISESAIESLCQQIRERADSEKINLDSREFAFTAGNLSELHARTARFSERGWFAPLVSSICTSMRSPLLAKGIEIADLPGYTDTNVHLLSTSKAYLEDCTKIIFVVDFDRAFTTPEMRKMLKEAIRSRGAENVCVVVRGKEVCDIC